MQVGDIVRFDPAMAGPPVYRTRPTPTAIVIQTWTELQVGHPTNWCKVLWPSGRLQTMRASLFEVINESR